MTDVLVVGAGMAGLAAARELQLAGLRVKVLESAPCAGGRVSTVRRDGAILDTGAQFLGPPQTYTHTFSLLKKLKLVEDLQSVSTQAALIRRGKVHRYRYGSAADFLKLPVVSMGAKLRLMRVVPELNRYAPLLDFHHLEKAAPIDDQDLEGFVTQLVGKEALDHLIHPLTAALYYYPRHGVSRAFLMAMVSSLGEIGTFCLGGGNARLPAALADNLDVNPEVPVQGIERRADHSFRVHAEVAGKGKTFSARSVVVAVPADIAAGICGDLTAEEQTFLRSVDYTAVVGVGFGTDVPFGDGIYGAAIAPDESSLLASATFEQNKSGDRAPAGEGLSIAFLDAGSSRRLLEAPGEEIVSQTAAEMDRLWPGHRAHTRWTHVFRHPRATPIMAVGYLRRLESFLNREARTRGLAFCGDYLCGPHVEGAVTSGLRAAVDVLRFLEEAA